MKLVNLFGAPGTGKSTTAAGVFHELKKRKVNCEYIQEYAKEKTWQEDWFSLGVQPYITAKQLYRQDRLRGKVNVAITDGCILNALLYPCKYVNEHFQSWLISAHRSFQNINVFIRRDVAYHGYETSGRKQTDQEAQMLEGRIRYMLNSINEPFHELKISDTLVAEVLELILQ